jgi:hypothetical protein
MLAEISFYNVVLFVHIAAVVLAFGVTFSYLLVLAAARKGYERHMGFLFRMQSLIGSRLIGPLGTVVLLAGIYQRLFGTLRTGILAINVLVLTALFLMVTKPGA